VDKAAWSSFCHPLRKWGLVSMVMVSVVFSAAAQAKRPVDSLDTVALSSLPVQAQQTRHLIDVGGPFPHDKDGVVFGNRERVLPRRERGFYREYTVPTPGSRDRGARRIVCGGKLPTQPDACYYTADHYASFKLIVQ
jgi:ribonuclease T1